jgi:SPP1 family holin
MKINIKNIKLHTWVSLVMVVIVIANQILTALGKPLIEVGEEQISYAVNTIINIVIILYTAWKNQSVTDNAQMADEILYALRDGKISKNELENFITEHKIEDFSID